MNNGFAIYSVKTCCLLIVIAAFAPGPSPATAVDFELTLESGSVLYADVPAATLAWTEVLDNGDLRSEEIPLASVDRLVLSAMPASQKVAEVRKNLQLLNSDNYWEREKSQARLSERDFGGPFRTLIENFAESPSAEVRYRVERVLSELGDYSQQGPTEFDIVVLNSGRTLKGDAGQFEWPVRASGQSLIVDRTQLKMVQSLRVLATNEPRLAGGIEVNIIRDPDGNLMLPEQTVIDFETDSRGNSLSRKAVVTDTWLSKGVRFLTPDDGHIAISGYGFKFPETPTGRNSACVFIFNKAKQTHDRFRGTVMVEFCVPGQPNVPAGVTEFGVYVARINHERDFILEAFNAVGQVVATVEADNRDCALLALKSNQPMTKFRIRSNPFLHRLSRKIDEDFAIDTVCFSTPVAVSGKPSRSLAVQLKSGDRWAADAVSFVADQNVSFRSTDARASISLSLSDVRAIDFTGGKKLALRDLLKQGTRSLNDKDGSWKARLDDGSVLNVRTGTQFIPKLQPAIKFRPQDVSALWSARDSLRFPMAGDFGKASSVVVFPTGRITTDRLKFGAQSVSWKAKDRLLQIASGNEAMPDISSTQYKDAGKSKPGDSPSVWQRPPKSIPDTAGILRTVDGQLLVFGDSGLFEFDQANQRVVAMRFKPSGDKFTIKIDNLQSIRFPMTPDAVTTD